MRASYLVPFLVALAVCGVATQRAPLPPGFIDPIPVLDAAARAIGTANLRCVTVAGPTAYSGAVGQQKESARNVDWPRIDQMANYTRTMNWDAKTMTEEFDRKPGLAPAAWKYGIGWEDGPLAQDPHQIFVLNGAYAWHLDGPGAPPVAVHPDLADIYQVELYLNPHGFLKAAALPGANPKATWRWELGEMGRDGPTAIPEKVRVVSISVGKYRIDATVNKENLLQRIHTWVAHPVLGDMNYEHEFTNESYIDIGNGIRFPTGWHSHQGWDDNYGGQNVSAGHNAFGGQLPKVTANACPDQVPVPEPVRTAAFPVRLESSRLAEGVHLLSGGSHNSVVIEFANYLAVFEAPIDETRNLAVVDEIARLVPDKPIRFVVNSHQHFDHAGGLRAFLHIGATIVTHWTNWNFYTRDFLNYTPRTMRPDMVSMWPPTELAEGYNVETVRENFVLTDGNRTMHTIYVNPLQHVDGMLVSYLPKEKMLLQADIIDTTRPLPAQPTPDQRVLYRIVQAQRFDVQQIVPVHGKPIPWSDFARLFAR